MSISGIVGPYGNFMFNFFRTSHTVFHILDPCHSCMMVFMTVEGEIRDEIDWGTSAYSFRDLFCLEEPFLKKWWMILGEKILFYLMVRNFWKNESGSVNTENCENWDFCAWCDKDFWVAELNSTPCSNSCEVNEAPQETKEPQAFLLWTSQVQHVHRVRPKFGPQMQQWGQIWGQGSQKHESGEWTPWSSHPRRYHRDCLTQLSTWGNRPPPAPAQ